MTLFTAIKKVAASDVRKNRGKNCAAGKDKKKLSRADKKQIEAAIARANRTDKKWKICAGQYPL